MLTLFLVCHTESYFNKTKRFTGWWNSKLTKEGHIEAEKLGEELKNERIDYAYRSDLIRTKETLHHLLKYHKNVPIIIDKRLRERHYGDLCGFSKTKYEHDHPNLYPLYHRSYDIPPPHGESVKIVEGRVMPLLFEIIEKMKKENINVLICAHGNSMRPIRKYFEHLSNEDMMALENQRNKIFKYSIK
jgi:2,3-bisphosphoglycerate-dependent phosphoglycerate mutase